MSSFLTHHRRRILVTMAFLSLFMAGLCGQLGYLMIFRSEHYSTMADDLHERERTIKAARGEIVDRNGTVIASNRTVCTVSVVHNQVEEPEAVIRMLSGELELPEAEVRKKVEKRSSREIIKTNVDKADGDRIRSHGFAGVKVDEDYKRYYPYGSLASKVLGFTGADNQGIIGLEVMYEKYLKGRDGKILTLSDAKGVEVENAAEERLEPVAGNTLTVSLDVNIQKYAEQAAYQVMERKGARAVSVIVMNPQNGEIYAMVNAPEFHLNAPFSLAEGDGAASGKEKQDLLNAMWRNRCINDTYEPGSTFKIVTALEYMREHPGAYNDYHFDCSGIFSFENNKIQCYHKTAHGSQDFTQAFANSCNGAFANLGTELDLTSYRNLAEQLLFNRSLPLDIPYSRSTFKMQPDAETWEVLQTSIGQGQTLMSPMHNLLITAAIANGGILMKPYLMDHVENSGGDVIRKFSPSVAGELMVPNEADALKNLMVQVVNVGTGSALKRDSYQVAGKTGSAEVDKAKETHAWFVGFAPADDPKIAVCVIVEEGGSGGHTAAPIAAKLFDAWLQ